MTRRLVWLAVALVSSVSLVVAAGGDPGPRTREERIRAVSETLRCPSCAGQSVADSDSPASRSIRTEIARRVSAGESDGEVRAAIAERYTDVVLLEPGRSGLAGLAWAIPVLVIVAGLGALAAAFVHWRRAKPAEPSDADRELVAQARSSRAP